MGCSGAACETLLVGCCSAEVPLVGAVTVAWAVSGFCKGEHSNEFSDQMRPIDYFAANVLV